jgi:hypothetical protein
MTKAYEAYRKSGNQDAENKYKEFVKFAANYSVVYAYAFVLMPEGSLDQLGRALPESEQRDTGRLTSSGSGRRLSTTPGAENRRRQRQRRLEMTNGSESSSSSSPATESMSSMMSAAMAAQQQQAALMFFATHNNDPVAQERALAMLARQALFHFTHTEKSTSPAHRTGLFRPTTGVRQICSELLCRVCVCICSYARRFFRSTGSSFARIRTAGYRSFDVIWKWPTIVHHSWS